MEELVHFTQLYPKMCRSLIDIRQASEEQLTNEQAALQAEVKREKQLAATWTISLCRWADQVWFINCWAEVHQANTASTCIQEKTPWHYNTSLAPWHHHQSHSSKAMEESADELAEGWYTVSRKGDSWKIWWRSWPLDDRSSVKKTTPWHASVVKCARFLYLILILFILIEWLSI